MLKRIVYLIRGFHKDAQGFWRDKYERLIHRIKAYREYQENREKYPLPYEFYIVTHLDGNKDNNRRSNLILLTPIEDAYIKKRIIREELPYIMQIPN